MSLRLVDVGVVRAGQAYGPDSWLPSRRSATIESVPEAVLKRELWRYLREEVEGRSFLLAGHRGAGKTTLTLRAVADISDEILAAAVAGSPPPVRQRPLLVKLHGPALFSGRLPPTQKPKEGGSDGRAGKSVGKDVPAEGQGAAAVPVENGKVATSPEASGTAKEELRHERTRAALAQVMASLYRALSAEAAKRFHTHAAASSGSGARADVQRAAERLELAARFRLELDTAPDPEALRGYYVRSGRLRSGVLWPDGAGAALDQGAREIVAIATAAQAFQVCTGAISYEHVSKDTGERSQKIEGKGEANLKNAIDKMSGLVAGATVGAGVAIGGGSAGTAAFAGVLGGVVTAMTFSWSSARSARRDETVEYRFIRDFSLATLDRELPEVIRRLRDAGIAPIFVIDELDKLDDMRASVEELVGRLKNLTTDYGFFCFLTNRAYYEDIWSRMRQSAYPREYTYFSNLLFVRYGALAILRYLLHVVRSTETSFAVGSSARQDAVAWITFAFSARHRSRLNTIALMRELSLAFDENGAMRSSSDRVASSLQGRLQATVQIAVDMVLEGDELSERVATDPLFAQLAVDALYRLSSAWENGEPDVALGPNDLAAYLRSRSDAPVEAVDAGRSAEARPGDGPRPVPIRVSTTDALSEAELNLLSRSAIQAATLLSDFAALRTLAGQFWTGDRARALEGVEPREFAKAGVAAFADILGPELLPAGVVGLVRTSTLPDRFHFNVDRFGAASGAGASALRTGPHHPSDELLQACDALMAALTALEVRIPQLVAVNVLSVAAEDAVSDALRQARRSLTVGDQTSLARQLPTLDAFVRSCVAAAPVLSWSILLARLVANDEGTVDSALRAIFRHLRVEEVPITHSPSAMLDEVLSGVMLDVPPGVRVPSPFTADAESVETWRNRVSTTPLVEPGSLVAYVEMDGSWKDWRERVLRYLADPGTALSPARFRDARQAFSGLWPGGLFRRRLSEMSVADWSALARAAFLSDGAELPYDSARDGTPERAPPWGFPAALAALGFNRDIVEAAIAHAGEGGPLFDAALEASRVRGHEDHTVLWIQADEHDDLSRSNLHRGRTGVIAVPRKQFHSAAGLIGWLRLRQPFDLIGAGAGSVTQAASRSPE